MAPKDIDSITGLEINHRKISDTALLALINREGCRIESIANIRVDQTIRRATAVIISNRLRSHRSDYEFMYSVTDLNGLMAHLYLSNDSNRHFNSRDEGAVVVLIDPIVSVDTSDRGVTLAFAVKKQMNVVVVGSCAVFGRCVGVRRDGRPCTMPVNTSVSDRCLYHPEDRIVRTEADNNVFPFATPINKETLKPQSSNSAPRTSTGTSGSSSSNHVDPFQEALKSAPASLPSSLQSAGTRKSSHCSSVCSDEMVAECRQDGAVRIPKESKVFSSSLAKRSGPNQQANTQKLSSNHQPPSQQHQNSLLSNHSVAVPRVAVRGGPIRLTGDDSRRVMESTKSLRVVGSGGEHSIMIDMKNLARNANGNGREEGSRKRKYQSEGSSSRGGGMSAEEIASLLKQESSHADEASEEWFEGYMVRMKQWERREAAAMRDEKVREVRVKAHQCSCGALSEEPLKGCRLNGHTIRQVAVLKRFYECVGCGKRDSTLGSRCRPDFPCSFCGKRNWTSCGKNRSGYFTGSRVSAGEKLVVGLTADTSRRDMDRIKGVHSSLDHTAK